MVRNIHNYNDFILIGVGNLLEVRKLNEINTSYLQKGCVSKI